MTAKSVSPPFPSFREVDGSPLESGYIYIGTVDMNPITNPVSVYWDKALSIPAVQPIRTVGGFASANGSPRRMYTSEEDVSMVVQDKNKVLLYSALQITDLYSFEQFSGTIASSSVVFTQPGVSVGAVERTAASIFADSVNVLDFGAVWDDSTDDSVAVQAAVDFAGQNNCELKLPPGTGRFSNISVDTTYQGLSISGVGKRRTFDGTGATRIKNNASTPMFTVSGSGTITSFGIQKLTFEQVDTSSGELLESSYSLSECYINDLTWGLKNTAKSLISVTAPSISNCQFLNHYGTAATGFTVSPYYIQSQAPGSYFNNKFSGWFVNSNNSATAPMVRMDDISGGATNGANEFSDMVFELCANGGAIHASSIRQSKFERIFCDDSSSNAAHLIHLDTASTVGSQASQYNTFIGCVSDEGDATWKDLYIEAIAGSQTVMINCRFDYVDIEAPPYTSINNQIISDLSAQPPIKIFSGSLTIPQNGNITFQEGMSVPEMQSGVSGVISPGGNEVISFSNTFSNVPKVVVSHVGVGSKGGPAQQSGASTTGVTIYNHGTAASIIDWVAVATH